MRTEMAVPTAGVACFETTGVAGWGIAGVGLRTGVSATGTATAAAAAATAARARTASSIEPSSKRVFGLPYADAPDASVAFAEAGSLRATAAGFLLAGVKVRLVTAGSGTKGAGAEDAGTGGVRIWVVEVGRPAGEFVGRAAGDELAGVSVRAAAPPGASAPVLGAAGNG